ncbi:hypothetical protein BRAO375_3780013 [Bradyrhizobium sp. ORS 375]|uniref:hypothetical protein n=1 Tax=Bradyrhizobium sp. (strain ORS 375) TaxID=566679 RepID=UPI0002406F42|nr:hypothetical protein [Bradyrhizobium sp. ORS 375]CCD94898.1 hypothetical protein BRAO375_3780013 [Bradyrhizobium sp. ORS 375]
MSTQLNAKNLGRYHNMLSINSSTFDFYRPYGKVEDQDTKTVVAWGFNHVPGQPCLVILQLAYNRIYLILYALVNGYPFLQAIAFDLDQAYQWMFDQGSIGSIVYRDDTKSLILNNDRWVVANINSMWNGAVLGYNGPGAPEGSTGLLITTQKVG